MTTAARNEVLAAVIRAVAPSIPAVALPERSLIADEAFEGAAEPAVLPQAHAGGYAQALKVTATQIASLDWLQSRRGAGLGSYQSRNYFTSLFVRSSSVEADHQDGLRVGLFMMEADTDYPLHSHAAHELYFLLSGACRWWVAGAERSGPAVQTSSWQPHRLTTDEVPALMAYVWWGDTRFHQYRVEPQQI